MTDPERPITAGSFLAALDTVRMPAAMRTALAELLRELIATERADAVARHDGVLANGHVRAASERAYAEGFRDGVDQADKTLREALDAAARLLPKLARETDDLSGQSLFRLMGTGAEAARPEVETQCDAGCHAARQRILSAVRTAT